MLPVIPPTFRPISGRVPPPEARARRKFSYISQLRCLPSQERRLTFLTLVAPNFVATQRAPLKYRIDIQRCA
jgi:hypothetical protein